MKIWNTPVIDELDIEMTANGGSTTDVEQGVYGGGFAEGTESYRTPSPRM